MKRFALLIQALEQAEKADDKVDLLAAYFKKVSEADIIHAIALLSGKRPKRVAGSAMLRQWAAEKAGIPLWLLEESYAAVGDSSETVSLLLPDVADDNGEPLHYWVKYLTELSVKTENERKEGLSRAWDRLPAKERFVLNKLSSATFRVEIPQSLIIRALHTITNIPGNVLAHRLSAEWQPFQFSFGALTAEHSKGDEMSKPYPFELSQPAAGALEIPGNPEDWAAEWKWEGLRAQIIFRNNEIFIWTNGVELVTQKFPELQKLKDVLPENTVTDGIILPCRASKIQPYGVLKSRMGRANLNAKILQDTPVVFYAFDLLEWNGEDFRNTEWHERRTILEGLISGREAGFILQISPLLSFRTWNELEELRLKAREFNADGIMLKRRNAAYLAGNSSADWRSLKSDPLTANVVLTYAMKGSGKRANLFTDYTFGIWRNNELVSIAKSNTGLSDKELIEIDQWINNNMLEKFGPVRTVKPELVFEIGFEGIQRSTRHKSGVELRFPRILRWRTDKPMQEADTIETLEALLELYEKEDKG
jgi:DNA ligase 1